MIKIYGKKDCGYCDLAKQLLESREIEYTYESVDTPEAVKVLLETVSDKIRTVPVVIIDGVWIGGYEDLKSYVDNNYTLYEGEYKNVLKG